MKAIGGYFELECGNTPLYHKDGIYLNICRSGFRFLIRSLGIKEIHVPVFTCHVVYEAIRQEGCKIVPYKLDSTLMPSKSFPKNAFIIYNNYFGVLGKNVEYLSSFYPNLIVDNAQAFYSIQPCRAAVYSPRKFFGLPDGGILRGKDIPEIHLEQGHSFDVTSHLLKRHDYGAQSAYKDFCANDEALEKYPVERMSRLTIALMGNIDYNGAKQKRLNNYRYLHDNLESTFPFNMALDDVPLVYPLLIDNGPEVRDSLIQNGVFCARYWPNVLTETTESEMEFKLATNIVSLPIDQRYDKVDMNRIIEIINTYK